MEVTVRGRHFDVPDHIEERARQKLGRLDHYLVLLKDAVVEVDLAHEKAKEPDRRFVLHATVNGRGVHLRAEARAARPEAAVDQVAHALVEQARRHKERLYGRGRSRESKIEAGEQPQPDAPSVQDEDEMRVRLQVAKVKRFPVKPMTGEEALEQMEALGHDFFVFRDAETEEFAVLYRREAGDYGLIVPEPQ